MMEALKTVSEGVAHDLRTPLGRLRNRLEELQDDPRRSGPSLDLAMREIEQITALFDSLLALSRLESGAQNPERRLLDAREIMNQVGEIYRPAIEDAGGSLHIQQAAASSAALSVCGNDYLLIQAVSNLIENAIVHGGDVPSVTIGA